MGKSVLAKTLSTGGLAATSTDCMVLYDFFKATQDGENPLATALCAMLHQIYGHSSVVGLFQRDAVPQSISRAKS